MSRRKMKGKWWQIAHWVLILNFLLGTAYGAYMVFFVVGGGSPLFQRARNIPFEVLVARRLYAIETWIIVTGLGLYLAITEILPRKLSKGRDSTQSSPQ